MRARCIHNKPLRRFSRNQHYYYTTAIWHEDVKIFDNPTSTQNSDSLVVWGTNLTSQVGKGKFTKQVSGMIKLPPYQKSIVIGLLLSDGWLTIASKTTKNARLGFQQSLFRANYVWFVFNELSHYCSSYPGLRSSIRSGNRLYSLGFFTRTLPCFTELYSVFYVNKVKVIPEDIYNLLTPVALAHLIMGDGSVQPHGLILCTDSFTIPDVVKLMNVLLIKYQLDCTFRFHRPSQARIYIRSGSMSKLKVIVEPYIILTMRYKLGIHYE